jgi:hypothetical protein
MVTPLGRPLGFRLPRLLAERHWSLWRAGHGSRCAGTGSNSTIARGGVRIARAGDAPRRPRARGSSLEAAADCIMQEYSGYGGSPSFGLGVGGGSDVGVGLSVPMFGGGGSGRYSADMDILVQDGQKPQGDPDAYDAFSVISLLQPKVLAGGS